MRIIITLTCFLILNSSFCFSQSKKSSKNVPIKYKPIASDCFQPIKIVVNMGSNYGPTIPPKEFGKLQEFKSNSLTFEKEHNSAWYLLTIGRDGEFAFDIVPEDTTNDYDFLLYNYTDSTFCDELKKGILKPIRNNLSNIINSKEGKTGLKPNAEKNTISKGVGQSYSNSINVKRGEKYILILDNVSPSGRGHSLFFYYMKDAEIKGKVVGEDSIPLIAEVTLTDEKGNTIEQTKSKTDGTYSIKTSLIDNQNYSLLIFSDSTFVETRSINTKNLKGGVAFPDIRTMLPKLKKGEKYKLGNINFVGGATLILPESMYSVEALYKLMQKNKKLKIQIEGHTNGNSVYPQKVVDGKIVKPKSLSEGRAEAISDYLTKKNIDKERIKIIGYEGSKMLYPIPKNEKEHSANRRVEIKVISIE